MNNKNYTKPLLLTAAVLTVLTALLLIIFRADTEPTFTFANVTFNLFLKGFIFTILLFALTTGYLTIRSGKNGLYLGIYSAISAVISSVVAFDLCALCRAPMGNLTFSVMLFCIVITYVASLFFASNYTKSKSKKKKNTEDVSAYDIAVDKTGKAFSLVFPIVVITIVAGAVLSFAFSAISFALCAAPVILSAGYSFALAINFTARLYAEKI